MSKIKTLFEDSAKQTAIYPRTKFSAVSDTNGNTLGDVATLTSTTVASGVSAPIIYAQPFGIDTARVLYSTNDSSTTSISYTATEDCIAFISCIFWSSKPQIDGVTLYGNWANKGTYQLTLIKGQTLSIFADSTDKCSLKVFGIKYGGNQ